MSHSISQFGFILFVFTTCHILVLVMSESLGSESRYSFSSIVQDFWTISCEFHPIVERSRRSTDSAKPLTMPNFDDPDPEELFNFLYPQASVEGQQRSMPDGENQSLFSTWWQDALDLWQSECHSRQKRSSDDGKERSDFDTDGQGHPYPYTNSTYKYKGPNMDDLIDMDMIKAGVVDEEKENGEKGEKTFPPPFPGPLKDDATYFASYGGDIEYFFPLISFGIPFDGEITLLGFHGFKGLFPYKK